MDLNDFKKEALKTDGNHDLTYYFLKLGSECGEVMQDYAKYVKHEITFAELQDKVQLELGDVMWYWMVIHAKIGLDPMGTMKQNITKLRDRYNKS